MAVIAAAQRIASNSRKMIRFSIAGMGVFIGFDFGSTAALSAA
jgi:hypothetical protein